MKNLFIDFEIAFRSLLQHTKRTLLLGLAIAGVTGLLVLLTGLAAGIQAVMVRSATTLTTGHVNVAGFYKITSGSAAPVVTDYEKVIADVKALVPELDYVTHRGRGWAKLISETGGSMQSGIGGVDIAHEPGFKQVVKVVSGKLDDLAQPGTILLFEKQAEKLDARVGDMLTISAQTTRGVANTLDVRVVAIAQDIGLLSTFNVYIPVQSLRALYQLNATSTGAIQLYLKDMKDIDQVAARLRTELPKKGYRMLDENPVAFWMKFDTVNREDWTGQKLDVTRWQDEISFLSWTLKGIQYLSGLLIGILLVIVVIGIMNTMWIAIRERTREIGTLRAIGMQRFRVLRMFLTESLLLGLLGTSAGAVLGAVVAAIINAAHIKVPVPVQLFLMSDQVNLFIEPASVVKAVVIITLVTAAAALYPSLRAARLKPVTAMHHIG